MGCCLGARRVSSAQEFRMDMADVLHSKYGFHHKRKMTNTVSFMVFILFTAAMISFVIYCQTKVARLLRPRDARGYQCGINYTEADNAGKRFLAIDNGEAVCVEECPDETLANEWLYCDSPIGTALKEQLQRLLRQMHSTCDKLIGDIGQDLLISWRAILSMFIVSLASTIIVVLCLRYCAGFIVWIILSAMTILALTFTSIFWINFSIYKGTMNCVFAVGGSVFTVIWLMVLLFLRRHIHLACLLFAEAGKVISACPSVILQAILTMVSIIVLFITWVTGLVIIYFAMIPVPDAGTSVVFQVFLILYLFSFFWYQQFIVGCQQVIVAGCVAIWYFTSDKRKPRGSISGSWTVLLSYHLGSVALGSLIVGVVRFIRLTVFLLFRTKKNGCGITCCCTQFILKMFDCCLKYVNRNAYILIAIYGYGYWRAAREVFGLLASNTISFFMLNSIGDFILFLGKVFVVSMAVVTGFLYKVYNGEELSGMKHPYAFYIFGGVAAWIVVQCYLSVYEMIMDTLLVCFVEDMRCNDGALKPYYMSASFMSFMMKTQRKPKRREPVDSPALGDVTPVSTIKLTDAGV